MSVSGNGLFHLMHQLVSKPVFRLSRLQTQLHEQLRMWHESRGVVTGTNGLVLRVPRATLPSGLM